MSTADNKARVYELPMGQTYKSTQDKKLGSTLPCLTM